MSVLVFGARLFVEQVECMLLFVLSGIFLKDRVSSSGYEVSARLERESGKSMHNHKNIIKQYRSSDQ